MVLLFIGGLGVSLSFIVGVLFWIMSFSGFSYWESEVFFGFMLDDVSLICLYMLLSCSMIALFYITHYFSNPYESSLLFSLMLWFVSVMGYLMISYGKFGTLIGWEFLGLVSFFLMMFYSNCVSLRAAIVTLVVSRLGDVALFVIVACGLRWVGISWSVLGICFLLVMMTKSAHYPFISWLLEAMRAPTPVSSLVHSSTLVAAGVWFLLRYSFLLDSFVLDILLFMSLLTIFISGVCAFFFEDLKKIVALSTCNKISWCILFFVSGDYYLSLLQLLSHGVCKCFLFMSVGDLMASCKGCQSSVGVFMTRYSGMFKVMMQLVLVLSLCGFPFMGVYFVKHLFMSSSVYVMNYSYFIILSFSIFLSYVYSIRFLLMLLVGESGFVSSYFSSFRVMGWLCFLGSFLNYMGSMLLLESFEMSFMGSLWILSLQLIGLLVGWLFFASLRLGGVWSSLVCGGDSFMSGVYSIFRVISVFGVLGMYRWESYLFRVISKKFSGSIINSFLLSLKVMMGSLGMLFLLFLVF